jgi:CsoR family transcriptional regulator, copper-sensing transcriptional repressor
MDEHTGHSYTKDRKVLMNRLSRLEGQVRGVDILQQIAALRAAVDALGLLILEDHVRGCVKSAVEKGEADKYVEEVLDVVRRSMGRPARPSEKRG